jgi:cytochrome P450
VNTIDLGASVRRTTSRGESKGLVFFLHGLGLYAEKFAPLYEMISELGYDVVSHDMLGHGAYAEHSLRIENLDAAARSTYAVYEQFAHERPILLGTGVWGGFMAHEIVRRASSAAWKPPSVLYSVDYVPMPSSVLRALAQRREALSHLDRIDFGYDFRRLTHDPADNERFLLEDAKCRVRFPLGASLLAGASSNQFYDEPPQDGAARHAFVYGTANRIAPIGPIRRAAKRHPARFRLFEVEGGAFHLHRDRPEVVARFKTQLKSALDHVGDAERAEPEAPPTAKLGSSLQMLRGLMFDPIGTIDRAVAAHGDCFTIEVPFGITPPFTFLTTREGYKSVLELPTELGKNGPVIDRVPALAKWAPRSDSSAEHLQTLLLTGRRFIGQRLTEHSLDELREKVRARVRAQVRAFGPRVDLGDAMVRVLHETSAPLLLGDELWSALGPDAAKWVRTIVHAVDAPRAATALSPAARVLPEYHATTKLGRELVRLARARSTHDHAFVLGLRKLEREGRSFADEDVAWMMFFAIWNATLYSGTYGVWSYLDVVSRPEALRNARAERNDREAWFMDAITETMRLNPISWQLRSLAAPVTVEANGRTFEVPEGHFLSVFSHRLNRDAAVYDRPLEWRPERYREGAPAPLLFGTGPFSCVAQRWVKVLLATVLATAVDELDVTLEAPLPQRMSRVHLLYPNVPVWASARRRAEGAALAAE